VQLLDLGIEMEPGYEFVYTSEWVKLGLDCLNLAVTNPMQISINEHVDIIDLMVEVGWCVEYTNVYEEVSVSLTVLNVVCHDAVTIIGENVNARADISLVIEENIVNLTEEVALRPEINLAGGDDVAISEVANILDGIWFAQVYDELTAGEYVELLDIIIEMAVVDGITVSENYEWLIPEHNVVAASMAYVSEAVVMRMTINFMAVEQHGGIYLVQVAGW
jgi:hypothetical protein